MFGLLVGLREKLPIKCGFIKGLRTSLCSEKGIVIGNLWILFERSFYWRNVPLLIELCYVLSSGCIPSRLQFNLVFFLELLNRILISLSSFRFYYIFCLVQSNLFGIWHLFYFLQSSTLCILEED